MLYFEQLLIAKVIYDAINHMNKYLMTYVNYDDDVYVIYDVSVFFFLAHPVEKMRGCGPIIEIPA